MQTVTLNRAHHHPLGPWQMIRKQLTYPPIRPRQGGAGSLGLGIRRAQTLLGLTSAFWASVSSSVNEAVGPNDLEGFSRGPLGWSCFPSRPPLTKANRRDAPSPGLRAGAGHRPGGGPSVLWDKRSLPGAAAEGPAEQPHGQERTGWPGVKKWVQPPSRRWCGLGRDAF